MAVIGIDLRTSNSATVLRGRRLLSEALRAIQ